MATSDTPAIWNMAPTPISVNAQALSDIEQIVAITGRAQFRVQEDQRWNGHHRKQPLVAAVRLRQLVAGRA
jgi:hypothetical protein